MFIIIIITNSYNFLKLAMYGMSQSIPDRSIVGDFTRFFLDSMYYTPKAKEEMNSNV